MRIAFIVDQFPTLSETFILNQITGLIDRGQEVDIYCDRPGNLTQTHPEIQQYQLLARTYYTPIPSNPVWRVIKAVWLLVTHFFLAPKTILQTVNLIKYNRANYGEPASFFKPLYLAIPWLKQPPYDLIFCHFGRNGLKAKLLQDLGLTTAKIVVVFHGYDLSSYLVVHGQDIYQELFQQADLILPISQHWRQKLITLGCPKTKILVHHMGINCEQFEYINKQLNTNQIRLISIARLVAKKGLQYSIQAVAKLIPKYPNLKYQIIGDGLLKAELQQLITKLNIDKNVQLLGWKKQQEVTTMLAEADIVLASSVTSQDGDCEGIPVSLMESMARGLPVISTVHSGIPELIEDGVSGYLLPEKDIDNLASKIEHLINHPELRKKMGQAGRQKVKNDYNIQTLNDRLLEILPQLLTDITR